MVTEYEVCQLLPVKNSSAGGFLAVENKAVVMRQMKDVLNVESPISKDLLYRRVLSAWGTPRMGSRITTYFDSLLSQIHYLQSNSDNSIFLWNITQQPAQYAGYRIAKNETQKRDAEDLPPEEIANAIRTILQQQISLLTTDLIRETAKLFGFARTGGNVETAMQKGIALAAEKGFVIVGNGRVVFNK